MPARHQANGIAPDLTPRRYRDELGRTPIGVIIDAVSVDVACAGDRLPGWRCEVRVGREEGGPSEHEVAVSPAELASFDPDGGDPDRLVAASFAFLLEREAPSSILRSFDLSVIERFFPEYPREIRRRLTGS
jgi:hypothetical protein